MIFRCEKEWSRNLTPSHLPVTQPPDDGRGEGGRRGHVGAGTKEELVSVMVPDVQQNIQLKSHNCVISFKSKRPHKGNKTIILLS